MRKGTRVRFAAPLLAMAALLAIILAPALTRAADCGNGNPQSSKGEQCECVSPNDTSCECTAGRCQFTTLAPYSACNGYDPNYIGYISCVACAVSSATCSLRPDMTVHTPDLAPPASDLPPPGETGAPPLDAGAPALDSGVPPPGTCRSYYSIPTFFDTGSLIINMTSTGCDSVQAWGLVWFLLNHGIRVAFVLDTSKVSVSAPDFSVSNTSQLLRTSPYAYNKFSTPSGVPASFGGGPFVIPAADADVALHLLYEGYLPQNPAVKFGWNYTNGVATFRSVAVTRAEASFIAPVLRMSSKPPKRFALYMNDPTVAADAAWLTDALSIAGLIFSGADGRPGAPGHVFDKLDASDLADANVLKGANYSSLWMNGAVYDDKTPAVRYSEAAYTNIGSFVDTDGSSLVASGWGTFTSECYSMPGTCTTPYPLTQFMSTLGLEEYGGNGSFAPPALPSSPWTQIGTLEYHTLAGEVQGMVLKPGSAWKPCVHMEAHNGKGAPAILSRDELGKGAVVYIAASNYGNNCSDSKRVAMQRTVLNTIFNGAGVTEDEHPATREMARSSPIVVERTTPSVQLVSFQGTFGMPMPTQNLHFNPSPGLRWTYPAIRGHLYAFDLPATGALALTAFDAMGSRQLWDGALNIPAAVDRKVYTATPFATTSYGNLTRMDFTTSNASMLTSTLGMVDATWNGVFITGLDAATDLIGRVRGGRLGGIDTSTAAYIPKGTKVTYTSYTRPTVVYVGATDGMIHAFQVKDIETDTGSFGSELWAFIPPNQLGKLKTNDAAFLASPTVADVSGDFLNATGVRGTDGRNEWVTLLTMATGKTGKVVYALDISNPDPSATVCPERTGATSCVKGPNPLWASTYSFMGNASGTSIGTVKTTSGVRPYVYVTTNFGTPSAGQGGMYLWALNVTTGAPTWAKGIGYTCAMPGMVSEPNDPPGVPALVDKDGTKGYQTHLYFADLQGRVWEQALGDNGASSPLCVYAAGGTCASPGTACNYPITSSPALYRDQGALHLVFVTGGAYWAPAGTVQQKLVDLNLVTGTSKTVLLTTGDRVYASPVIANRYAYVTATRGLPDVLATWEMGNAPGTIYRINLASLWNESLYPTDNSVITSLGSQVAVAALNLNPGGTSSSTVGVSSTGSVVATTAQGMAVEAPAVDTAAMQSTRPQDEESGAVAARLRLWLPSLRK